VSNERPNPSPKAQTNIPWLQGSAAAQAVGICTLAFAVGSLLVIVFFFLPVIDQAKVARAEAKISIGDNRIASARQDAEREISDRHLEGSQADERRKKFDNEERSWKLDKASQQAALDDLRAGARGSILWYDWGMMFAFILLALASLGFVVFGQTVAIRVVGGTVIVAQILLVFVKFLSAGSSTIHLPGA
jgi:hypothetical protein